MTECGPICKTSFCRLSRTPTSYLLLTITRQTQCSLNSSLSTSSSKSLFFNKDVIHSCLLFLKELSSYAVFCKILRLRKHLCKFSLGVKLFSNQWKRRLANQECFNVNSCRLLWICPSRATTHSPDRKWRLSLLCYLQSHHFTITQCVWPAAAATWSLVAMESKWLANCFNRPPGYLSSYSLCQVSCLPKQPLPTSTKRLWLWTATFV